ncbi:MAG: hypothetical protein J6A89_04810 [Clostridia bacterium]|nr:hypothetical protein [Clostridia bacterium]
MKKLQYFENEKNKSKKFINNISIFLENINPRINELGKSKNKTDNIMNIFQIQCFNYNLVNEMIESKERLKKSVDNISKEIPSTKIKNEEELNFSIKKIDYMNDILDNSETQLKTINKDDLKDIEKLQMNAIKKGIYDKYMLIKSEIDRDRIKNGFDKIQNKSTLGKVFDRFFEREDKVDTKKENLFMLIHEIDEIRQNILKNEEPKKEYKIIEILADIDIFLKENEYDYKYRAQIQKIKELRENIVYTFSIDKYQLRKAILDKQKSRFPAVINKKMSKVQKERQKAIAFLTKNGYIENVQETNITSKMGSIIKRMNTIAQNIEKIIKYQSTI